MKRLLHVILLLSAMVGLVQAQPITNISATVQVHPAGKMAQYSSLTFNAGYVITPRSAPNANLSFRPGSSWAGASDASHVNGYAEVVGSSAFTFPIGNGTTLRTAGITAPASGTFQAAYFGTNAASATLPLGAPFNTASLGTGVSAVSTAEYWDVNGPSAVNITLSWNPASGLGSLVGSTLANLAIVGWDGSKWVNLGGTATGTLSGTGTIATTAPITPDTYTAYTFGKLTTTTPPATTCGIVIHGPTNVEVLPGGHMAVYCDVTFISGDVDTPRPTPNDNITFMPGTGWFDASDGSHVNGYVEKVGNTAFTFPVGDGTVLRPVGMSAPASSTSTLQAAYFSTNPSSGTLPTGAPFATTSRGMGVSAVSPVEYWDVNGSEPVDLTFTWNPASNLNTLTGGTISNLIMVGWDGAKWVDLGSPTTTGTLSGTGTLNVTGITPNAYTAYTFGAKGTTCPNPSVGGTVAFAGSQPLCSTANTGTLTLSGQTGNVLRWETSTDNGSSWTPITNATASFNFTNVANNQQYRAVVNAGGSCADANSTPVTLTTSAAACSAVLNCAFAEAVISK
ncbi:hypothetical protein [uncultured Fibrella sp.]|uniref:hypothetical protein n=1 Tax=uncultured Fibrella sp. TaxID=1284596 RepID=UPI0035CACF78